MAQQFDYDLFVIGAGSGGVRAARIAATHGARVAIAEEYRIGGTCVIRGCVPKKLLVYGSTFAEQMQDAEHYGWSVTGRSFDWAVLRDRVLADVDRISVAYTQTLDKHGVDHFLERAVVTGAHGVALASGREISARHILIAVGAWPAMPDFPGVEHCITSNEVFHLPTFPKRVVIQGAGYIAMEFAGIFNGLGAHVTVVNRSAHILRSYDRTLRDRLIAITTARGIEYHLDCEVKQVVKRADGVLAVTTGTMELDADVVLIATGRRPKVERLGLERAGVALGKKGEIIVDGFGATSCPSIHAVGDVTDRVQLTPVAIREGHLLADRLFAGGTATVDYRCIPSAVFSQPPIASVGPCEEEARREYPELKVFTSDFRPMKNVFAERIERGFYKLLVDGATDRVVAVHLIGPDSPEILQAVAIAVKAGLTKADFDATMALHPSMAEELVLMR